MLMLGVVAVAVDVGVLVVPPRLLWVKVAMTKALRMPMMVLPVIQVSSSIQLSVMSMVMMLSKGMGQP